MKTRVNRAGLMVLVGALLGAYGCSKRNDSTESNATSTPGPLPTAVPAPSAAPETVPAETASAAPVASVPAEPTLPGSGVPKGVTGSLAIEPNPLPVCEKTGLGAGKIIWELSGGRAAQIRVDAPDGNLFVTAGKPGSQKTGVWVRKGMTFYLQDLAGEGKPTAEGTIAKLTVDTVPGGPCP